MKVGRESRGLRAACSVAGAGSGLIGGTLFIRSYERGERVHLAMVSRGYAGAMPELAAVEASAADWL